MDTIDGLSPENYKKMCEYTDLIKELNVTLKMLEDQSIDPINTENEVTFTISGKKHMINNEYLITMLIKQINLIEAMIVALKVKTT